MAVSRDSSIRRALLLACAALATLQYHCHAFSSYPDALALRPTAVGSSFSPKKMARGKHIVVFGKAAGDEDRAAANVVVIRTHEDYVKFLEEDDRLCVIKFYANWCKSCQRFGQKFRHFAFDEGDHVDAEGSIVHTGMVRFAEAEYSASAKLCKSLKVRKLPTVHMYRKGRGKIADMTCKPSLFHLVIDEVHRLMDDPGAAPSSPGFGEEVEVTVESKGNGNVTNTSFDELAGEIMSTLKKKEEEVGKASWFPFKLL